MASLNYHHLKCPRCGNRETFEERANRLTSQRFTVNPNTPDQDPEWDVWDAMSGGARDPKVIICTACQKHGSPAGVIAWDDKGGYNFDPERREA